MRLILVKKYTPRMLHTKEMLKCLKTEKFFFESIKNSLIIFKIFSYFLLKNFFNDINFIILKKYYINIFLKNNNVFDIIFFLKNSIFFSCDQLLDFTIVDCLELAVNKNKRFEFVYVLVSTHYNLRILVKGFISIFESLRSLVLLYSSVNWLEREVWDLFGIFIVGHPDLRRLLTDYGFTGFPFRKDFPLSGYVELRYDEVNKYVVLEPLELSQEFRLFKFDNPWKKKYKNVF